MADVAQRTTSACLPTGYDSHGEVLPIGHLRQEYDNTGDANFYSPYNDPVRFTADDVSVEAMEGLPLQAQISYSYAARTLTVTLPSDGELPQHLLIYDLQGRVVLRHVLTSTMETLSVATLPEGVYIVKVAGRLQLKIKN